jgi:hypothetical protein
VRVTLGYLDESGVDALIRDVVDAAQSLDKARENLTDLRSRGGDVGCACASVGLWMRRLEEATREVHRAAVFDFGSVGTGGSI